MKYSFHFCNINSYIIFFHSNFTMASNPGFDAGDDNGASATNRTERRTPANGESVPNESTTLAGPGISTYFVDEKVFIPEIDKVILL